MESARTAGAPSRSGSVPVHELTGGATPDVVDLAWLAQRLVLIAIGNLCLVVGAIARAAVVAGEAIPDGPPVKLRPDLGPPARAAVAVVLRSLWLVGRVGGSVVRASTAVASKVAGGVGTSPLIREVEQRLAALMPRDTTATSAEAAARAFADSLVPTVVTAVADRVDVTEMILDRTDLNRIVNAVDLDAVVANLPVDEVVSRLDVDAVAARLDLDTLIARLDLAAIAAQVIEEVDLPEIIRESTGELGTEAIDTLRFKSMNADRVLFRWRDRLLAHRADGADGTDSVVSPGGPAS
jgi:hypothetical protein